MLDSLASVALRSRRSCETLETCPFCGGVEVDLAHGHSILREHLLYILSVGSINAFFLRILFQSSISRSGNLVRARYVMQTVHLALTADFAPES